MYAELVSVKDQKQPFSSVKTKYCNYETVKVKGNKNEVAGSKRGEENFRIYQELSAL